eukprot:3851162-Rhodomonas_salina.1
MPIVLPICYAASGTDVVFCATKPLSVTTKLHLLHRSVFLENQVPSYELPTTCPISGYELAMPCPVSYYELALQRPDFYLRA